MAIYSPTYGDSDVCGWCKRTPNEHSYWSLECPETNTEAQQNLIARRAALARVRSNKAEVNDGN